MKTCCRCGGALGEQLDDGFLACYHCYQEGTCNCPDIKCEVCGDTGIMAVFIEKEYIEFPGESRYYERDANCTACNIGRFQTFAEANYERLEEY